METKLNIPSTVQDANYRYKMPQMQLKVEGKNQNTKTVVTNIVELAKALNINPEYIIKFMAIELGVRPIFETKTGETVGALMGQRITYEDMLKFLDKFIEKYILCPKCRYPELHLRIKGDKKKGEIHGKCESCGFKGPMDQNHKIINTMLDLKPIKWGIEAKEQKKAEKDAKEKANKDDEEGQGKKEEKKKKSDGSEKALKGKDIEPKSETLAKLIEGLRTIYKSGVKEIEGKYQIENLNNLQEEFFSFLSQVVLESKNTNRIYFIVFQAIFDINIAHQIQLNSPLLKLVAKKFALDIRLESLVNIQYLCYDQNKRDIFSKIIPTILKHFYDEDILPEDFLIQWSNNQDKSNYEKFSKSHFLENFDLNVQFLDDAQPIINWLKQADEEEDEEEEKQQQ